MAASEGDLTDEEMAALKAAFDQLDCAVRDLNDSCFEISHQAYQVATHVYANQYFLQLSTVLVARPKGFPLRTRNKLHAFLNRANCGAKLAKFTLEGEKVDPNFGGWLVTASIKFVNGAVGGEWDKAALNNCLNLWLQDVAEFILLPSAFGLEAIKRGGGK